MALAFLLAGCTTQGENSDASDTRPRLADFTACNFTYPDGVVPCQDAREFVEPLPGWIEDTEPGWICEDSPAGGPQPAIRECGNPITNDWSIGYDINTMPFKVQYGMLLYWAPDKLHIMGWNIKNPEERIVIHNPPRSNFRFILFDSMVNATPAALQDAKHEILLWPYTQGDTGDGQPDVLEWVTHKFSTADNTYYFSPMRHFMDFHRTPIYGAFDLAIHGADFDLNVTWRHTGGYGSWMNTHRPGVPPIAHSMGPDSPAILGAGR